MEALVEFIGDLIEISGKLLVAWTAIMVHHRFRHEHRIDEAVFRAMNRESRLGMIGIILIIVGFIIRSTGRYLL